MKSIITPTVRTLLLQSLRPVEAKEDEIRAAFTKALARSDHDPELSDTPAVIAALLVSFLIEQVRHVVETGQPMKLELHRAEHRLHDIHGRHYSRFGDALVPVLKDALGGAYPRATASAWSDAFWAILREMRRGAETSGSSGTARNAELVA